MTESVEIRPYFAQDERYPSLVGVRVGGDEYETAYVSKAELMSVMDENAKLRELVASVMDENAKLRELVADVHEAFCSDKAGMFHKLILASMEDDMRELGIEVETE